MQIEEGKFYKNRAGEKVGPMASIDSQLWAYPWMDKKGRMYTNEGLYAAAGLSNGDLIEEWEEPAALPPATEVDEGWGPWNEGRLPHSTSPMACDYREECINGVWRWQSRPRKPVVKWDVVYVQGEENPRGEETHKILFKKINGVIDCSSVKMEPL